MSKSQSHANSSNVTIECRHPDCTIHGKKWEFRDGEYCSTDCETKHTGRKHLLDLKYDHTHCFTCFTQLKTIEPPKPDHAFDVSGTGWTWDPVEEWWTLERYGQEVTSESAVGFQYRTPSAGIGEKQTKHIITTGTICDECGSCDHTVHIPHLADPHTVAARVVNLLEDDDLEFSAHEIHREFVETADLELALGRAID